MLQRQYGNRYVQRLVDLASQGKSDTEVSSEVEQAIQQARGRGQAMDSKVRTQMESALGVDFSGVRVHTGNEADTFNRALDARAFTTGQDIFFRQGEYNPGGSSNRELLAHELTHVVQQGTGSVQCELIVSSAGDKYEQDADRVAEEVMRMPDREMFGISESASIIQKKCAACPNGSGKNFYPKYEEKRIQRKPLASVTALLMRCENKTLGFGEDTSSLREIWLSKNTR